jgi:hypothetical protein
MNNNLNVLSSESQNIRILEKLLRGGKLTDEKARIDYNCNRLAARAWDLRKKGFPIQSKTITTKNNKRIAQYHL